MDLVGVVEHEQLPNEPGARARRIDSGERGAYRLVAAFSSSSTPDVERPAATRSPDDDGADDDGADF